jgi:hypothetical protein
MAFQVRTVCGGRGASCKLVLASGTKAERSASISNRQYGTAEGERVPLRSLRRRPNNGCAGSVTVTVSKASCPSDASEWLRFPAPCWRKQEHPLGPAQRVRIALPTHGPQAEVLQCRQTAQVGEAFPATVQVQKALLPQRLALEPPDRLRRKLSRLHLKVEVVRRRTPSL